MRCAGPPPNPANLSYQDTLLSTPAAYSPFVFSGSECVSRCKYNPPPAEADASDRTLPREEYTSTGNCSAVEHKTTTDAGVVSVYWTLHCEYEKHQSASDQSCGRRPEGFRAPPSRSQTIGDLLADAALLERASVDAFAHMVNELTYHNAPQSLIARSKEAKRDEVRHAKVMATLAKAHGSSPPQYRGLRQRLRPLKEIAIENMVEGCIRETYGALIALHQGRNAKDKAIANAMSTIAKDELSHAALSWDVHQWIMTELSDDDARALQAAAQEAIAKLKQEAHARVPAERAIQAGLPSAATAVHFLDEMDRAIWRDLLAGVQTRQHDESQCRHL